MTTQTICINRINQQVHHLESIWNTTHSQQLRRDIEKEINRLTHQQISIREVKTYAVG